MAVYYVQDADVHHLPHAATHMRSQKPATRKGRHLELAKPMGVIVANGPIVRKRLREIERRKRQLRVISG
jgi:hypothetical protein